MHPVTTRVAALMGSASLLTLTNIIAAHAQTAPAALDAVPEQVLVTGSLIHGTAAVGVPVTNLGTQDLTQTGNVTIGDLFRTVPEANVSPGPTALNSNGHQERETRVNLRGLDATGPRSLMMVDGVRFPPQADGLCAIDPSIIPALALDRVDILADGASATYGSDAISGVINIVLKRGFDGAVTQLHVGQPTDGGGTQLQASQLWGRTWEGGDITITYEWSKEQPIQGTTHSNFTVNYAPWGLAPDTSIPLGSSIPGVITTGAPKSANPALYPTSGGTIYGTNIGTICTNCWSIPRGTGANFNPGASGYGPTAAGSASTISWAQLTGSAANAGANNFIDPLQTGEEQAGQQRNAFVLTVDQRLFPGVSFFGTGFYNNRRIDFTAPSFGNDVSNSLILTVKVPTINPYYPAGAPAGLQVSYDFARDLPPTIPAWEISERYEFGLNIDLPYTWSGQVYDSRSYEDVGYQRRYVSKAGVNAALGNNGVQAANPATGAPIPFLNVFCDPTAYRCNSPQTLQYIGAQYGQGATYSIDEKGARIDGPLFDIPGGSIKAAIGGLYDGDNVVVYSGGNAGTAGNQPLPSYLSYDHEPYHIWAEFAQIDIPVFGDNFNIPLARKLDLEASIRHDQYSGNVALSGETTNPKLAFTWLVDDLIGATVRGSWGSSFRFANAGEFSTSGPADQSVNLPTSGTAFTLSCSGGAAPTGTTAAALVSAGFNCTSAPGGIVYGGGPMPILRQYTTPSGQAMTREGGIALQPEKALNYSLGVEVAPTIDFLKGLDLQATWYSVKINGVLNGFTGVSSATLSDPTQRFHFILPSDLGCPVAANTNPTTCAPFEKMVTAILSDPNADSDISQLTNVYWLDDAGTANSGFLHVEGVDWNASYDYDAGDLGAWDIGITGTYYLHRWSQTVAGGPVIDQFHQNLVQAGLAQNGVETLPRMVYRARLGWSDGPFNATVFYNYFSHYYETRIGTPANVNMECIASGSSVGGGTFPCAINNYSGFQPAWNTFDLSFGYSTGTTPENTYLQNITLQLTIQNVLDKHASFEYGPVSSTRNPGGYDINEPNVGRVVGLTLVKNW